MVTDILIHSVRGEFPKRGELITVNTVDNFLTLANDSVKIEEENKEALECPLVTTS